MKELPAGGAGILDQVLDALRLVFSGRERDRQGWELVFGNGKGDPPAKAATMTEAGSEVGACAPSRTSLHAESASARLLRNVSSMVSWDAWGGFISVEESEDNEIKNKQNPRQ